MTDLLDHLADIVRRIAGVAAATLPARLWPALDAHIPVTSSAIVAGLLTMLGGLAIGIPGFFVYAAELASIHNQLMLTAATSGVPGGDEMTTAMPVAATALSLFTFILLTPLGWASAYLVLTGGFRAAAALFDDPLGDPMVSVIDMAGVRLFRSLRARRARARRESLEGPEVPDRIVTGAAAGLPDADLVVVASRRKPDWDAGTVVLTSTSAYRVGVIVEREIGGRLRTLYPLQEHRDLEAFRRIVRYEISDRQKSLIPDP